MGQRYEKLSRTEDFYNKLDQVGTGNKTNLQHIKDDKSLFTGKSMGLFKPPTPSEEYVGEIEKCRENPVCRF